MLNLLKFAGSFRQLSAALGSFGQLSAAFGSFRQHPPAATPGVILTTVWYDWTVPEKNAASSGHQMRTRWPVRRSCEAKVGMLSAAGMGRTK